MKNTKTIVLFPADCHFNESKGANSNTQSHQRHSIDEVVKLPFGFSIFGHLVPVLDFISTPPLLTHGRRASAGSVTR